MSRWALCGAGLAVALGLIVACAKGETADVGDPGVPDLDGGGDVRLSGNDGGVRLDGAKSEGGGTSGCTGKVVINELQSNGTSNAEFVELFNPNDCTVELAGWKLLYRSNEDGVGTALYAAFGANESIAAGGFFVLGNAAFKGAKDATFSGGGLGNSGGQVGLVDPQDKLVDAVGYKSGTAGLYTEGSAAPDPGAGSIGRKSDGVDTDDNAADFAVYDDPSPGASNP